MVRVGSRPGVSSVLDGFGRLIMGCGFRVTRPTLEWIRLPGPPEYPRKPGLVEKALEKRLVEIRLFLQIYHLADLAIPGFPVGAVQAGVANLCKEDLFPPAF